MLVDVTPGSTIGLARIVIRSFDQNVRSVPHVDEVNRTLLSLQGDSGSPGLAPGSHGLTARQDTLPQLPMCSGTSTLMLEQMEPVGFAPTTFALQVRRSPPELRPRMFVVYDFGSTATVCKDNSGWTAVVPHDDLV